MGLRRSADTARGIWLALTDGKLEREWADALAGIPEEVEEVNFRLNAERMSARVRAKLGFGPGSE